MTRPYLILDDGTCLKNLAIKPTKYPLFDPVFFLGTVNVDILGMHK